MGKSRPYIKYVVRVKGKTVHGGITTDFERRKQEHKQTWPSNRRGGEGLGKETGA